MHSIQKITRKLSRPTKLQKFLGGLRQFWGGLSPPQPTRWLRHYDYQRFSRMHPCYIGLRSRCHPLEHQIGNMHDRFFRERCKSCEDRNYVNQDFKFADRKVSKHYLPNFVIFSLRPTPSTVVCILLTYK